MRQHRVAWHQWMRLPPIPQQTSSLIGTTKLSLTTRKLISWLGFFIKEKKRESNLKSFPLAYYVQESFLNIVNNLTVEQSTRGSTVMFEDQDKETNSSSALTATFHNYSCHNYENELQYPNFKPSFAGLRF